MVRLSYILTIISVALMCVLAQEFYSAEFDSIDVESILQDEKELEEVYKCFMGLGPCVRPDAKFFQETFVEAYQTKCKRCTELQKHIVSAIEDWYLKNSPEKWEAFIVKYRTT